MSAQRPDPVAVETQIAREILAVHEESYGVGAENLSVHQDGDLVVIIIDVILSRAEATLVDAGRPDAVKAMRESFQAAIAPSFNAIVERATGRRVRSFLSSMSMEPLYSVEVFRLAP